jgi:hypothetical protein
VIRVLSVGIQPVVTNLIQRIVRLRSAQLIAATIAVVGLLSVQVSSKQSPHDVYPGSAADFRLKNPNAFDPARRRPVRAMKEPLQPAASMAAGIDTAEAEAASDSLAANAADSAEGRVANATFTELGRDAD